MQVEIVFYDSDGNALPPVLYQGNINFNNGYFNTTGYEVDIYDANKGIPEPGTYCQPLTRVPSDASLCSGQKVDVTFKHRYNLAWSDGHEIRLYSLSDCSKQINVGKTTPNGQTPDSTKLDFTIDFDDTTFGASTTVPEGAEVCQFCSACAKGKYHDPNDACNTLKRTFDSSCLDCPIDTFADETGLTECKACPEGQHQPVTGSEACICSTDCPAGKEFFIEQLDTTVTVNIEYYEGVTYTQAFKESYTSLKINGNGIVYYNNYQTTYNLPATYSENIVVDLRFYRKYVDSQKRSVYLTLNGERAIELKDDGASDRSQSH